MIHNESATAGQERFSRDLHSPLSWRGLVLVPWNNGKEVPRWGVAEILKMSPSTTGRCSRQTADQWERGTATRQPITLTYYICCPGVVGRSVFAVQAWSNL